MQGKVKPVIAITIGDAAGIGPEIVLKALKGEQICGLCRPLVVGSARMLEFVARQLGMDCAIVTVSEYTEEEYARGKIQVVDVDNLNPEDVRIGAAQASTGKAMLEYTDAAVQLALQGRADAVIGGPHTKKSVELAGFSSFNGYPEYVAGLTNTRPEDTFLMLCAGRFRVVNVTLHVSLRQAIEMIDKHRVLQAIRAADQAAKRLGVSSPRIAAAGLNPHAGEEGMFGREEIEHIAPAVEQAKNEGIRAFGPFGCDTMFAHMDENPYDVYIAMYHDQAHIAAKMIGKSGVSAMTIGTPVLFSSVGHGSALDIAGKGLADPAGLMRTVELLSKVSAGR
jgi:4-hydroxythreonine-4-phosphate dehydrogenase